VAFVQNRISSCCSCRFEMCFLSPHVQEQVLVFVFLSSGEFGAGIVARAGGALSPLLFIQAVVKVGVLLQVWPGVAYTEITCHLIND
jgi:hypothetical protein